ncbi:MAG: sterol desaturase family protein [Rhodospirillales bacterium]
MTDAVPNTPRSRWNFVPRDVPLRHAPYAEWPLRPMAGLAYYLRTWLPDAPRFWFLVAAIVIWTWFTPDLERAVTFQFDWMFEIWLRDFILVLVVAGGLHLWLHGFRGQGDDGRYDGRPLARKSRVFHFNDQVLDNMFWTLASSVPIGALTECLMWWAYANGYATMITLTENPVWFIALMILVPLWGGFHFYWYHRLFHVEPLYRWWHSWHHKNINVGPWSGHAMHPVEHVGLYSDSLIYLLIPAHPVHVLMQIMLHTLGGPVSHTGYDEVRVGGARLRVGDFFHQLHHRYFDCNYGVLEMPWDRMFGSFHDGTPEGDALIAERRRRMQAEKSDVAPTAAE